MVWLWLVLLLIGVPLAAELGARLYHRLRYLVPFHSKVIGRYPFKQFLEDAEPPLCFRFKKNFSSPVVEINRFGCRGPQPAPDGQKKRLLVIGESYLFGIKLLRESDNWSAHLQRLLDQSQPGQWEVINAGNPGYSSDQHLIFWRRELKRLKPDILILAMGGNDTALASMLGEKWTPQSTWPRKFIEALERPAPWWRSLLGRSCLYFVIRRWRARGEKSQFAKAGGDFPWQACVENIEANFAALIAEAREMGTRVAGTFYAPAVDFDLTDRQKRQVASIQANWQATLEHRTAFDLKLLELFKTEIFPRLDLPLINTYQVFKNHPRRYEMYFDLAHWNHRGMPVVAQTFFDHLSALGWLDQPDDGGVEKN